MIRSKTFTSALAAMALLALIALPAAAQDGQQQPPAQPKYTAQEYRDYQAAANEQDPATRVKSLEGFLEKYPGTELSLYAYQGLYQTCNQLKNHPKTIDYADKLVALGDKVEVTARLGALQARVIAFLSAVKPTDPNVADMARKNRDAALEAVKLLGQVPKPADVPEEKFIDSKKPGYAFFHHQAGYSAFLAKDFKGAIEEYKKSLAYADYKDGFGYYRLGLAYFQSDPPQQQDGFWAIARALTVKIPNLNEQQVRTYLRNQILRYQQPGCEKLLDQQLAELLALAAGANDRPADFVIPSREELNKKLEGGTIDTIMAALQANDAGSKTMWLAACGSEFPELGAKAFEVTDNGSAVHIKAFTAGTVPAIEASTAPNVELIVENQPDVKRVKKDDTFRYAGALSQFTPDPFLITLNKVKVNPEDIPAEEAAAPAKKAPAKKAPPKKATKPPTKPGR